MFILWLWTNVSTTVVCSIIQSSYCPKNPLCRFLCRHQISTPLGKYQRVQLLGHAVSVPSSFLFFLNSSEFDFLLWVTFSRALKHVWTGLSFCYSKHFFERQALCTHNPGCSDGKESACNAGDLYSIPGSGRSPREENGNTLPQYSCLENPMDRGAWQTTPHGVTKSQTWLSD